MNETTRQPIDVPIQPRSARDLKTEVHKKSNRLNEIKNELEAKIRARVDKGDSNAKTGKIMQSFKQLSFFQGNHNQRKSPIP